MRSRRRRRELDEHTACPLRVEKTDHAGEPRPRRLIDQRQPGAACSAELGRDVRRLEADVVQSLAATFEELGDAARRVDRLEELDLAPPDGQKRRPHALVAHRRLLRDAEAERIPPEGEPVLETAHDQADVVDARQHRSEAVRARQLRVLRREQLRERHHHPTLLPRRVVLHLAVEHEDAAAVRHRLEDALGELHLLDGRAEDALGDLELARVQRPGADAAEEERGAELVLAAERVRDVAEGAVERQTSGRRAGVDHAGDRVVPRVLLGRLARRVRVVRVRVGAHEIRRVAAADARRLHAARRGEVRRAEADALHARARGADLLDVGDTERGLEDGVHQKRAPELVARLELGEEAVGVVDVPRPLDLGDHDDLEPIADLADQPHHVVEEPRAVEAVDARPERRVAEVDLAADADEALACVDLAIGGNRVLEIAEEDVGLRRDVRQLGGHLRVGRVEEVDHARRLHRDLERRHGPAEPERLADFPGALFGALLGGIGGAAVWWGITIATHVSFGLVAVVIGVAVGKGIVSFTGGKRAESLQVMAVVVAAAAYAAGTYLTKRTFILESLHRQGRLIDLPLVPTSPAYFFRIASAGFQLFDLVFLAIVMYQAWRIPAPVRLPG